MKELIERIKDIIQKVADEKYKKPQGGTHMIFDLNQLLEEAENGRDWWAEYQEEKNKAEKLQQKVLSLQDEMTNREAAMYDQVSKNSILERDLLVERTQRQMIEEFHGRNRANNRPMHDYNNPCNHNHC